MTAPPQLQPDPSPFAPRNGGEIGPCPEAAATSTRRSQPSLKRKIRPLTLLSPSAIRLENQVSHREPRTASPALASTRAAFPARSAFHRHVRRPHSQASPATDPAALPPRSGFRRSFAPPMLSHERARSSSIARAYPPGVARTARRLSTSAIKTIVEHNCPIDRTPLTAPRVAPKRSSWPADRDGFRRPDQPAGRVANAPFEARPAEISRARGKRWVLIQPLLLSTRSLALRAYPQPDRLRHLLSRARLGAGMENPTPRRSSIKRMLRRAAWQNPLSRFSP